MSFILNALRKSEQERVSNHTATLEDKIQLKQEATEKSKPGGLVILNMINLLLLAFLLWYFTQQEEEYIDKKPVNVTGQSEQKKPVKTQISKPITTHQITIAQQVNNRQEKQQEDRQQQASLKAKSTTLLTKTKQAPQKSVTEQLKKVKKPEQLVVSNNENDPPYLSNMPYDFQLSVPNININVFVYTEHPEGRFIMIDMQKYQRGQQINKDMKLHEIRPNSIVVEYKNRVFQIKR